MDNTTLTIQIDSSLRERAEIFYNEKGIDLSKAICKLLYQSIEQASDDDDPPYTDHDIFYSKSNIAAIKESIESSKQGRVIEKSMNELRAYET